MIISFLLTEWSLFVKLGVPFTKECFVARWFWRRRFLNFVNEFLLFRNYLPLLKGWPFFKQTCIPYTVGCFVPRLVEIGPVVLEKKIF